ncbi:RNA polymerase sigma factor [Clostridium amylolyticum]|nr:RNA polymerase sigma factor [Clostridium amylolyticum]
MEELYHMYGKEVFKYLCWLTNDPHRAEDILQETFMRAITGILRFEGKSSIRTWLFSIARNCYIDDLRKHKEIRSLEDIPELVSVIQLEDEILGREVREKIKSTLETLDERSQKVIALRNQGFSFLEIGKIMGISEGSARVINHRAIKRLKEILEKEEII